MEQFVVSKVFKISPSKDSDQTKTWALELTIPKDTTAKDLARAVLASEVIKTQNGNRSKFDKFEDNHVFKKTFSRPGYDTDPREAMKARLAAMTPEERKAEVDAMLAEIE